MNEKKRKERIAKWEALWAYPYNREVLWQTWWYLNKKAKWRRWWKRNMGTADEVNYDAKFIALWKNNLKVKFKKQNKWVAEIKADFIGQ